MLLKSLVKGLLTRIPGLEPLLRERSTGGTNTASYSYGVWLKHLSFLWANGMREIPGTIAELGPGDSIGIGLAAVLSGANRCYALDVQQYANTDGNLRVFDELVELFRARAPRPTRGWPDFDEYLDERKFPSHVLTEERLTASLAPERLARIREAIARPAESGNPITVRYIVPWSDAGVLEPESVDLILSQSVLEHVVDVPGTYAALDRWLKPGGRMSHQVDFDSHGLADRWNGYRAYSETFWRILMGKRIYMINREPSSTHVRLIEQHGMKVLCALNQIRDDGIPRSKLAPRWKDLSDTDFNSRSLFVQALKPAR